MRFRSVAATFCRYLFHPPVGAITSKTMMLLNWLSAKNPATSRKSGKPRPRRSFGQTTLPLISPRRGRRILRREQLFSVVRESMIRAGVLSSSYEFKVLTLDANGDSFLVLVDLALPADVMPDEYLLEIERWIQGSAESRHEMAVRSVYWRRKAVHDQRGIALKAAVAAQTRRDPPVSAPLPLPAQERPTAFPVPERPRSSGKAQPLAQDEIEAFRQALQCVAAPVRGGPPEADVLRHLPQPESLSDFSALSETQYGKL